jgi:transposase
MTNKQGDFMRYIQGVDRNQSTMLPETVDEYIKEDSAVRFIDAYVDNLDLVKFNFTYSETKDTGRKPYNPADLLKLYIYGYMNKIRSSRQLEHATHRNIELIWLIRRLRPDFKTIADFRKDNTKAIRSVCRDFTLLCRKLDLFGKELIAIDGSKFKASNSNSRNFTKNKLNKIIKKIDEKIDSYLNELDEGDEREKDVKQPSAEELKKMIEQLRKQKGKYQKLQSQITESGETQISLTDPDSRMMQSHQGKDVTYNVQIVTDSKHKLIVTHEVTNDTNDMKQLHAMAVKAKEVLETEELDAVADAGYFERENIKKCHDDNIKTYVPKPTRSHNKSQGLYTNADFLYDSKKDTYQCPAGQTLTFRGYRTRKKSGLIEKKYTTHACYACQQRVRCTRAKRTRYIYRWEHEEVLEQLDQRMQENPEKVGIRKSLVEHTFGTIKHWMGHHHFMTRGIGNVSAEMSLSVLAYNLKRILNIVNFKELMAVVT